MSVLWKTLETGPKGKVPDVVYVIVEIPKGSRNKYEMDKESGAIFLDRDLFTSMEYPGDYGSIPQTLCGDGDPVDALVLVTESHYPGIVIPARPVALIKMTDEKGRDDKVLCVPEKKIDPRFNGMKDLKDIPDHIIKEITHFFMHMKELEPGKWTKIEKWENSKKAKKFIEESIMLYKKKGVYE